jgi:tetratricopeptide (TPR) repeat protein
MSRRRPGEVLFGILVSFLSAPLALSAEPPDLSAIVRQFKDSAEDWQRVASFLARQGKWADAAKAQQEAVQRDARGGRLLLARYQLHAGHYEAAAETLERIEDSRAKQWLRVELHLAHDDLDAAERELEGLTGDSSPADDAGANLLHCGESLRAADVEDALRAHAALAREDAERALQLARRVAGRARHPDARVLASFALEQLGQPQEAVEELEALRDDPLPPQTHCPGILLDRVLFNQANIAARAREQTRSPAELYRRAIAIAAARERTFHNAVSSAGLPLASPLNRVLLPARRDPDLAFPEAQNNLGQYLLRTALQTADEVARGQLLVDATKAFRAAAFNPHYATRQYAFAGLARVKLAAGERDEALAAVRPALMLDPQNRDALDVAAALAQNEEAALLLVSAASEALPAEYAHEEFDGVLRAAIDKAKTRRSEVGDALLTSVDLWNGDLDSARKRIASARKVYASSRWPVALEGQLAAQSGDSEKAAEIFASLASSMERQHIARAWEIAAMRPASATYNVLAAATENGDDVRHAQLLAARVSPSAGRFPWEVRRGGLSGVITDDVQPLPGVTVIATGAQGVSHATVTDAEGRYHFNVPAGTYDVTAELSGMQTVKTRAIVTAEGAVADLALRATVQETVTVTAEAPIVDVTTSTVGVTYTNIGDASGVRSSYVAAVSGSAEYGNVYVIDGVKVGDSASGARLDDLFASRSLDDFQEMRVVSAGILAENPQPFVMLLSRTGGNEFRGDFKAELSPARFRAAAEPVAVPSALYAHRDEAAAHATIGGPIIRNYLWFFLSGDIRDADGSPDEERRFGETESRATELFAKLTGKPLVHWNAALALNRRGEERSGANEDVAGAIFGDEASVHRAADLDSLGASISMDGFVGTKVVVEARGGKQRSERSLRPESSAGEAVQQRDVLNAFFTRRGAGIIEDGRRTSRTNAAALVALYLIQDVEVRAGGAYEMSRDRVRDRLSGGAIEDVLFFGERGTIRRYWFLDEPAAVVNESSESETTAAHAQVKVDVWRVVINAGVRWERQAVEFPSGHDAAVTVLQPRLGAVLDVFGNGRSRVSATYARYADPLSSDELLAFGSRRRYVGTAVYGTLDSIDPGLRGRFIEEFSASVGHDRIHGPHGQITAVHRRLQSQIEDYFCTLQQTRCVGNPGRGKMGGPAARREITSVEAVLQDENDLDLLRNDLKLNWRFNYTWSRGLGNVEPPDVTATRVVGIDPYARTAFDFPSLVPPMQPLARDRRHTIIGSANFRFHQPYAEGPFTLGLVARWRSGEPLGRFGYSDAYGRYVTFLRARGTEGRTPDVFESDVSLAYLHSLGTASLSLGVAVTNVLNRQTMLTADQRWSFTQSANGAAAPQNPNYLEPMTRLAPQTVRVFARLTF